MVDATYRGDLKELNELNFAQLESRRERGFAEAQANLEKRLKDHTRFEPPRDCRRLHSLRGLESCRDRAGTDAIRFRRAFGWDRWSGDYGGLGVYKRIDLTFLRAQHDPKTQRDKAEEQANLAAAKDAWPRTIAFLTDPAGTTTQSPDSR